MTVFLTTLEDIYAKAVSRKALKENQKPFGDYESRPAFFRTQMIRTKTKTDFFEALTGIYLARPNFYPSDFLNLKNSAFSFISESGTYHVQPVVKYLNDFNDDEKTLFNDLICRYHPVKK
jgi:hypothetical protein